MLKIKDNVDLKELEKFGFVYLEETTYSYEKYACFELTSQIYDIVVFCENREICLGRFNDKGFIKLFDLIQAGLVEKVVE